jgi:hypothetical protein
VQRRQEVSVRRACGWLLALACTVLSPAALAQAMLLTLLDGDAVVTDGARRVAAVSGLRLAPGAIVETANNAALARIEWPERGVVDLGPGTRAMLAPPGFPARSGKLPVLYLLQGWAKVAGPGKEPFGAVVTPGFELLPFPGVAVVFTDARERLAFAESGGSLEVVERPGGKRLGVAQGALYSAGTGVLPRPPADWPVRVPRAFRDPLPLRAAAFRDRTVNASALPDPTYVQLQDWLGAEAALRQEFPRRFAALAKDAAFRKALQARLAAHPEWNPVLNPPPPARDSTTRETR